MSMGDDGMERLTRKAKDKSGYGVIFGDGTSGRLAVKNAGERENEIVGKMRAVTDKLGRLEDLEEEIGVGLEVLAKALRNGIWVNRNELFEGGGPFPKPVFVPKPVIGMLNYGIKEYPADTIYIYEACYVEDHNVVRICDYGKTWALAKEELKMNDTEITLDFKTNSDKQLTYDVKEFVEEYMISEKSSDEYIKGALEDDLCGMDDCYYYAGNKKENLKIVFAAIKKFVKEKHIRYDAIDYAEYLILNDDKNPYVEDECEKRFKDLVAGTEKKEKAK